MVFGLMLCADCLAVVIRLLVELNDFALEFDDRSIYAPPEQIVLAGGWLG